MKSDRHQNTSKIREKTTLKFKSGTLYALWALRERFGSLIKKRYFVGFPSKHVGYPNGEITNLLGDIPLHVSFIIFDYKNVTFRQLPIHCNLIVSLLFALD